MSIPLSKSIIKAVSAFIFAFSGATIALPATAQTASDLAQGEVRKIDKETKKITLKHGEIKNLDMPPMTMVFQVKDANLLDKVKPGDKIQFRAVKEGSNYTVTDIVTQ
jgi:Cu(I)/Ag(I) efflux system periplasmic protein CusF